MRNAHPLHALFMRLHRFYIEQTIGNKPEVIVDSPEIINQVRRVFRLKKGDSVILFDSSGSDYECVLGDSTDKVGHFNVVSSSKSVYMPTRDVILYAAITKKDTFEWIVEKATELGVTKIVPVLAERSEKKSLNMERLHKISVEASEQCGRGNLPMIQPIVSLEEVLSGRDIEQRIVFHIDGQAFSSTEIFKTEGEKSPIMIFIGPEGGWSPEEISTFHKHNMPIYSLGKQVLRAETAVISALSLVLLGKK